MAITHASQNIFINYVINLPYQLIDDLEVDDESSTLERSIKGVLKVTVAGSKVLN